MKKLLRRGVVLLLALMLAIPCVGVVQPEAAAKTKLSSKSMTISIGKYSEGKSMTGGTRDFNELTVKNGKKGAKYSFTSSNKKVATVKGSGTYSTITGVKAGTTTITVKEKYKGKTTTVGTCKVTVKKATVGSTDITNYIEMGNDISAYSAYAGYAVINIAYMNASAKYTFKSSDPGFKMSQIQEEYGGAYQIYTATKAGTYKVTVTETYKKKSRKVGTVSVTVLPISVPSTATAYVGDESGLYLNTLLTNAEFASIIAEPDSDEASEYFTIDGVSYGDDYVDYMLYGKKAGTAKVNFYVKKANGSKGDLVGTCTVTVKELAVKEIKVAPSITLQTEDEGYIFSSYGNEDDDDYDYESSYGIVMEEEGMPYPAITYTSSDPSIVAIDEDGYLTTQEKTGTATITISCGGVTKDVEVTVVESQDDDDDYYDDDYYDDDDDDYYDDDDDY